MALFDINELYEKKISGQVEGKAKNGFAKISPEDMIESNKTQAVQGATNAQKIMLELVEERKFEEQEDE